MWKSIFFALIFITACDPSWLFAKSGDSIDVGSDVHQDEIQMKFKGICICPRPPPKYYEEGEIWEYWEPFLAIDTVSAAYYSPHQGDYIGSGASLMELNGVNSNQDSADRANSKTFTQAHAWLYTMMYYQPCKHRDYGFWMTENDSKWNSDELSAIITPEASAFASLAGVILCETDALAVNLSNKTIDALPQCIGSSGMSYPLTGQTNNPNTIQANNTSASRLIYKLNRLFMICDPAESLCGCSYTPVWVKSHYKMHVVRPADRAPAYPVGKSSKFYDTGLNPPYEGDKGSSDEFLWIVYRLQKCCTCCDN